MIKQPFFHPLAEEELDEAAGYYESQRPGLGSTFLDEVERAISLILEYPEAGPLLNRVIRKGQVRRFPYDVLYSVEPEGIWILAIANQKRRPLYWQRRM